MIEFFSAKTCDTFATIANHAKGTFKLTLKKYPTLSVSLVRNNKPKYAHTLTYNIYIETIYGHAEPYAHVIGLLTLKPEVQLSNLTINDDHLIALTHGLDVINHYYDDLLNPNEAMKKVPNGLMHLPN